MVLQRNINNKQLERKTKKRFCVEKGRKNRRERKNIFKRRITQKRQRSTDARRNEYVINGTLKRGKEIRSNE